MFRFRIKTSFCQKISGATAGQKLGIILLLLGSLFLAAFWFLRSGDSRQRNNLSFEQAPPKTEEQTKDPLKIPQRIIISSRFMDLPVEEAEIISGEWQVSATGASHLARSALPGEKGNVIIYGHNKNNLFGPIKWMEKGEEVIIANKKGEEFVYEVIASDIVSPSQIEALMPTEEPTLTLYTCYGLLDRQRLVIFGRLKKAG
jgi:LPXTG-site transpeptidase (sortase) family protein